MDKIIEMKTNDKIVKYLQLIDNQIIKITFEDNIEIDVDTIKNAFEEYDILQMVKDLKNSLLLATKP